MFPNRSFEMYLDSICEIMSFYCIVILRNLIERLLDNNFQLCSEKHIPNTVAYSFLISFFFPLSLFTLTIHLNYEIFDCILTLKTLYSLKFNS